MNIQLIMMILKMILEIFAKRDPVDPAMSAAAGPVSGEQMAELECMTANLLAKLEELTKVK